MKTKTPPGKFRCARVYSRRSTPFLPSHCGYSFPRQTYYRYISTLVYYRYVGTHLHPDSPNPHPLRSRAATTPSRPRMHEDPRENTMTALPCDRTWLSPVVITGRYPRSECENENEDDEAGNKSSGEASFLLSRLGLGGLLFLLFSCCLFLSVPIHIHVHGPGST